MFMEEILGTVMVQEVSLKNVLAIYGKSYYTMTGSYRNAFGEKPLCYEVGRCCYFIISCVYFGYGNQLYEISRCCYFVMPWYISVMATNFMKWADTAFYNPMVHFGYGNQLYEIGRYCFL